ncbi:MAG: hypothetical protein ACXV44_07860 [Halobacteriota archaeon]
MRCGACHTTLQNEAEERIDGRVDLWICKKCYVARELEPYDKPETAAEQDLYDELFSGKKYPRPLSEDIDALVVDLKARLEKLKKQRKEPEA